MTVLVFDSGIGGLSVMREARMMMHDQQFVYVGDDAGFPYGDWQEQALTARVVALFEILMDQFDPRIAIVACNTASTLIMPALRERFDIPFVGIVPAIKPAAERTASGLISVLATPGTVSRPYIRELIEQFAGECTVNLVGATKLARLAEQHMQLQPIDTELLRQEIWPCFVQSGLVRTDIVTLGCTHYPFLVDEMRKLAPWPVDWLDPARAVARQAQRVLAEVLDESAGAMGSGRVSAAEATVTSDAAVLFPEPDLAIMTSGEPHPAICRLLRSMGMTLQCMAFPAVDQRNSGAVSL